MQHRASAPDLSSAAEAAVSYWMCSKMLLLFFSRCKKQTPIQASARNKIQFYMLLSIFSIAYPDLRRKSKTVPMLCQYCGVFSLLAVTASYRQVKLLRRLDVLLLLSSRILRFCAQNISGRFLKQIVSKLNHAQIEMYFRSDFCNYTQFSLLNTVLYLT